MKNSIRRILSGALCAALLAASASPQTVSVAKSDLLSDVSVESSTEVISTEELSADPSAWDSSSGSMDESTNLSAADDTNADGTIADNTATDDSTTDAMDTDGAAVEGTSTDGVTIGGMSTNGTTVAGTATDGTSADGTGADGTSVDTTSVDATSADDASADDASADNTSADDTDTDDTDTDGTNAEKEAEDADTDMGASYVSALAVKSLLDGTAPFDGDDDAGNDSGSGNLIVRTFDYVNYTLEYTTALMDPTQTVDEAYLMAEFTLGCDPSIAEFNTDTLNWCVDQAVTYVYADGSSSTSWDSSKTVTEQVLTGKRYLSKSGDSNAIPGTGTLSVGVYVKAAKNGDQIQPSFTVWMEGNEDGLSKSVQAEMVKVTAAPRYNINLVRNNVCSYLAYFDTESGIISDTDIDGSIYGRLEGYALTLQLYNTSADKGLKGIELPAGEITFDLTLTETLDGTDVTAREDYTPLLWDYRENEMPTLTTVGNLGRAMTAGGSISTAYGVRCQPYNSGGASDPKSCYEGGGWIITQDSQSANIYHVSVSDYAFDLENLKFPTTNCENAADNVYGANIGCFSACYVQIVVSFERSVESTSNLYFWIEAGSLAAASLSGQTTSIDQDSTDDSHGVNVTLYPEGSVSKRNNFNTTSYWNRASEWYAGDFYAAQGEQLLVKSVLDFSGDGYMTSVNILQKIDDEAFEVPAGTTSYYSVSVRNERSDAGEVRVLFAAKPDKTGWQSEAEMNAAHEETLIYFESIDDLNAAGYICVGFLYEVRNCAIYSGSTDTVALLLHMLVEVKDSAEIGSVYEITNDLRAWRDNTDVFSWTELSYGGGAYGLGDSGWSLGSYVDGYSKPTYTRYMDYGKTVYENGSVVAGHTGGYKAGNSCLIIGCKTGVSIQVADTTATTAGVTASKSVYDLDIGERTVTYVLHPTVSVVSENREVSSSADTADVTVWATLPKELTYIMDSASLAPTQVIENDDGTSTILWELPSQKIGEAIEDITLSCLIGAAGTADDVQNNDTITISAAITADKDDRLIIAKFGNCSETTISVIRLASTSISKAVERSIVEEGEKLTYILRYGNSAKEEASGVMLYDILPYDGDTRGSAFGGDYVIESIEMDFSSAPKTLAEGKEGIRIRTTTAEEAREVDAVEAILGGSDSYAWTEVSGGTISGSSLTFGGLAVSGASGMVIELGTVKAQEYVKITVTLSVRDASGALIRDSAGATQMPGDLYANSFYEYADGQVALVESNTVKIQVAKRTISGLAWLDVNSNGIRESTEGRIEGLTVSIYRTSLSDYAVDSEAAGTVNSIPLYTAYDVFGNVVKAVLTDTEGNYGFYNLESGLYYVVFTGTEAYDLTLLNMGTDDTVDSDAIATASEEGAFLENAWIGDIAMPALEEMYSYLCESGNHDAGFVALTEVTVNKIWEDEENRDGYRADFLRVTLSGSDGGEYVADLTDENDWSQTFTGLPVYDNQGEEVVYTVKEDPTAYYEEELDTSEDGYTFTFTNTHEIFTTERTVVKNWDDAGDRDGIRPDSVKITLTGSDGSCYSAVLTAEEDWTYTFKNLPQYINGGEEILYSLSEAEIDGYTSTAEETEDGFLLTNQHTPKPLPEPEPEPETDNETESESESEIETETEAESESETERETETGSESEIETETESESESEIETETESERENETETEADHETEAESEPETAPVTESEPDTESATEAESETETDHESETETESESEKQTEAESETESENPASSTSSGENPKTGDSSRPLFWLTLALAALGFMGANLSGVFKRKHRDFR